MVTVPAPHGGIWVALIRPDGAGPWPGLVYPDIFPLTESTLRGARSLSV